MHELSLHTPSGSAISARRYLLIRSGGVFFRFLGWVHFLPPTDRHSIKFDQDQVRQAQIGLDCATDFVGGDSLNSQSWSLLGVWR